MSSRKGQRFIEDGILHGLTVREGGRIETWHRVVGPTPQLNSVQLVNVPSFGERRASDPRICRSHSRRRSLVHAVVGRRCQQRYTPRHPGQSCAPGAGPCLLLKGTHLTLRPEMLLFSCKEKLQPWLRHHPEAGISRCDAKEVAWSMPGVSHRPAHAARCRHQQ